MQRTSSTLPHPLICYVAHLHGVPVATLLGPSKRREYMVPRAIACYLLVQRGFSLSATGHMLGRHHTSIANALEYVEKHPELKQHADQCLHLLVEVLIQEVTGRPA